MNKLEEKNYNLKKYEEALQAMINDLEKEIESLRKHNEKKEQIIHKLLNIKI